MTAYRIDWRYIHDILVPDLGSSVVRRILLTCGVLIVLFAIRQLVRLLAETRVTSHKTRYYWSRISTYLLIAIGLWCLARVWLSGMKSFETFLGLISAGVAIALKDPLVNLAGFVAILVRHPFRIGQRVQVGEIAGDVVDIRALQFTMLEVGNRIKGEQSTGRLVHIPNAVVFTTPLINYQGGFDYIWNEISIPLPPDIDWQIARQTILEIVERHAETDKEEILRQIESVSTDTMIRFQNVEPIVYVGFDSPSVVLTARYLCRTRLRRFSESHIYEEILTAFPKLIRDPISNAPA